MGGSAGRTDSQWASRAPEELRERGWGTQRANPGAPAAQYRFSPVPRGPSTQWATTGAPDAFCGTTSARRGSGTEGTNHWAPCGTAPLFACAQGILHPVGHRWGP